MIDLVPLGDRGWLARFATEAEARGWAQDVSGKGLPGLLDVVVAYARVAVHFDPCLVEPERLHGMLSRVPAVNLDATIGQLHVIPTLYDGPDLGEVARRLELEVDEVVRAHASVAYDVLAVGFQPGFPYAGPLADSLRGLPRRESPRPRVASGSVAIVGNQTAIYPRESPGGWHLIGRTPLMLCDIDQGHFPVRAGDRLRFEPIDLIGFSTLQGQRLRSR